MAELSPVTIATVIPNYEFAECGVISLVSANSTWASYAKEKELSTNVPPSYDHDVKIIHPNSIHWAWQNLWTRPCVVDIYSIQRHK